MESKTYTNPYLDTTVNFWRNAAFTGALLWGFHGSWKRTLAVSAISLPLIAGVGYLRCNTNAEDDQGTEIRESCRRWRLTFPDGERHGHCHPEILDPVVHLLDVACFFGMRRALRTSGAFGWLCTGGEGFLTASHLSLRFAGLWPHETENSRHHDSLALGIARMRAFWSLGER